MCVVLWQLCGFVDIDRGIEGIGLSKFVVLVGEPEQYFLIVRTKDLEVVVFRKGKSTRRGNRGADGEADVELWI